MTNDIIAVDIDMRCFSAWSLTDGVICHGVNDVRPIVAKVLETDTQVLIEVAGPMVYGPKEGEMNRRRWMIWNSLAAGALISSLAMARLHREPLIASSATWTKGLKEEIRHKLANVVDPVGLPVKSRHDLRECQAMIWTYQQEPSRWVTLDKYLDEL